MKKLSVQDVAAILAKQKARHAAMRADMDSSCREAAAVSIRDMSPRDLLAALKPAQIRDLKARMQPGKSAATGVPETTVKAIQRPQAEAQARANADNRAANSAALKRVLATNVRMFGASSSAATVPADRNHGWDDARAEMLHATGRA